MSQSPQQFDINKLEAPAASATVSPKEGMSPAVRKFLEENSKKKDSLNPSASESKEPPIKHEAVVVNPVLEEVTEEVVEEVTEEPTLDYPVEGEEVKEASPVVAESPKLPSEESPLVADPAIKGTRGVVHTTKQFYSSRKLITESNEELVVPLNPFPKDAPLAQVSYQSGLTINLSNYNSAKISVSITLPTTLDQINDCYLAAQDFVDTKVSEESEKIQEYRSKT